MQFLSYRISRVDDSPEPRARRCFGGQIGTSLKKLAIVMLATLSLLNSTGAYGQQTPQIPEGVLGWKTPTGGIYPWATYAHFQTPEEACVAQHAGYAPNSGNAGVNVAFPISHCTWTTHIGDSHPASVTFECVSGWERRAPGICINPNNNPGPQPVSSKCAPVGFWSPPNPVDGNPVEIATGRKTQHDVDYSAPDARLVVERHYTSVPSARSPVSAGAMRLGGVGWTFDFGPIIRIDSTFGDASIIHVVEADQVTSKYSRFTINGVEAYGGSGNSNPSRYSINIQGGNPSSWATVYTQSTVWKVRDFQNRISYTFETKKMPGETTFSTGFPTNIEFDDGYSWNLSYGTDAELLQVVDSYGRSLLFTYLTYVPSAGAASQKALIDTITLPDGSILKYSYERSYGMSATGLDPFSRMVKVEKFDAASSSGGQVLSTRRYHYEDARFPTHLTGITDERGIRYATWTYDQRGRVSSSRHGADADLTTFAYNIDTAGSSYPNQWVRTTTVTNPLGKQAIYEFRFPTDGSRPNGIQLISIKGMPSPNCPASNTTYAYDSSKQLQSVVDAEGRVTKYNRTYGELPDSVTTAFGTPEARTISYQWTADLQVKHRISPELNTEFLYDGVGRLVGVTQTDTTTHVVPYSTAGQSRSWTYAYTAQGKLSSIDGPLPGSADTTSYTYDPDGNLASVVMPNGLTTTVASVDSNGRPLVVQDANNVSTVLTYDDLGYLSSVTIDPTGANSTTLLTHDEVGQLTRVERADGSVSNMIYDDARRLASMTDGAGNTLEYSYDPMGNVVGTFVKDPSNSILYERHQTFDELGRLLASIGANSASWQFGYDKVGNQVLATDPRGGNISTTFDGLNNVISIVDQSQNVQSFERIGGNLVAYNDGRGIETNYVRNGWGEIIQESSPDIGVVVYERNELGLAVKKTDARGVVANYSHDAGGRLTAISYPAASAENVTFTYDSVAGGNLGKGYLTGIVDQAGTATRIYNSLGLLASESRTVLGSTATTSYAYDDAGNLFYMVYPSGRIVSFWRDPEGEINSVAMRKAPGAPLIDIADDIDFQPFGDVQYMRFENGLNLWRSFDQNYRDEQLGLYDGSTAIMSRYHGYIDELNLTNIWDNVNSAENQSYWYAANNSLQDASGPWGDDTYYFDGAGNRTFHIKEAGGVTTTDQYFFGASNRPNQAERNGAPYRSFTSDPAGNLLTDTIGASTTGYAYNNADRLSTVTKAGLQVGQYTYNALGQMVIRTVTNTLANGTSVYFYDQDGHVIAEYDGSTGAIKREYIWLGDRPIAVVDPASGGTDAVYYIHADHLNRPIAMTDASKVTVAKFTWLPFGGLHSYTGTKGLDLRFPGQMFQAESGLHYNWNRHYDPTTGRYTQPDPLGLVDAPSRFAYVKGDPLQSVDPLGLQQSVTCGPLVKLWFDMLKSSACNGLTAPRKCTGEMGAGELRTNMERFQACATARMDVINICYGGEADRGHLQQLSDTIRGRDNCAAKLRVCGSP